MAIPHESGVLISCQKLANIQNQTSHLPFDLRDTRARRTTVKKEMAANIGGGSDEFLLVQPWSALQLRWFPSSCPRSEKSNSARNELFIGKWLVFIFFLNTAVETVEQILKRDPPPAHVQNSLPSLACVFNQCPDTGLGGSYLHHCGGLISFRASESEASKTNIWN